jgi:prevent-host-death family protein
VARQVNIHEAKTHLSRLVDEAAAGDEIVIARAGKPVARLVGLPSGGEPRKLGMLRGKIWIGPDFDEPLPDEIQRAFDGEGD